MKKTVTGFLSCLYSNMQARIRGQTREAKSYKGLPIMTRKEFVSWATNDSVFLKLHKGWLTSERDRKLVPSIDRIDSKKGYIAGNLMCDSRYLIGQTVSALLSPSDGFRPGNGRSSAMVATDRNRPQAATRKFVGAWFCIKIPMAAFA